MGGSVIRPTIMIPFVLCSVMHNHNRRHVHCTLFPLIINYMWYSIWKRKFVVQFFWYSAKNILMLKSNVDTNLVETKIYTKIKQYSIADMYRRESKNTSCLSKHNYIKWHVFSIDTSVIYRHISHSIDNTQLFLCFYHIRNNKFSFIVKWLRMPIFWIYCL